MMDTNYVIATLIVTAVIALLYLVMGFVTLAVYRHDKHQAETEGWRVPEVRMHFLELCFGWIGAFVAQRVYRHKTVKRSYQTVFWIIGVIHVFFLVFVYPICVSAVRQAIQ